MRAIPCVQAYFYAALSTGDGAALANLFAADGGGEAQGVPEVSEVRWGNREAPLVSVIQVGRHASHWLS